MKTAFLFHSLLVLCICGLAVQGIFPLAGADPVAGYWNFSPDSAGTPLVTNATGQPVIPANQSILPGDPLYALMLSFEQLDLSFTPNTTVRIEKSMHYTENRLLEADTAQRENRTGAAQLALTQYSEDLNTTLRMIGTARGHTSGPLHVRTVLSHHIAVLNRTITRNPGSTDLLVAYNRTAAVLARSERENSTPVNAQKTPVAAKAGAENRSAPV